MTYFDNLKFSELFLTIEKTVFTHTRFDEANLLPLNLFISVYM